MALTLALGLGLVVPPPTQASEGGRPAVASDGRNEGRNEARSDARHEARGEVKGGQRRPREAMSSDDAIEQLSTRIAEKLAVMRTGPSSRAVEQPRLTVRTAPPASATTSGAQVSPMTRPVRSSYDGAASAAEVARTAALANGQPVPSLPAPARDSPAGWTGASLAMAGAATGPLTAATATPAAALAAAHRRAGGAGPSAAFGAVDPRQWSYAGERGPEHWATLDPAYASCGAGTRQSPIDIRDGIQVDLAPIAFDYKPSAFRVIDTGHTIQVNVTPGNTISVMGRRYELQHFHFRKPSEERVAGRLHDMSAHLVHKDGEGRVAVIAVLIERGGSHPVIQSVWNHLPLERHTEVPSANPLDVAALLPAERGYWTYMGSLTTPPCTEGVLWMVMKQPVQLSEAQIGVFGRLYPMNARPIQQSFGRRIMESN